MNEDLRKWHFLRDVPAKDAQSEEMRALAGHLYAVACMSPWKEWAFANLALAVARDCIVYMSDITRVGREQIDGFTDPQGSTLEPLTRGVDDCDAKARMFCALCLCVNIPAKMHDRWHGETLTHVSAEVYLCGPGEHRPNWRPVETILDRAKIGDVAEDVPVEIDTRKWAQRRFTDVGFVAY